MEIAIIADDLTGAADSGIHLARAGYRTAISFWGASIPPAEDLDAVVVDTDSRLLSAEEARERVERVGRRLEDARIVYKKIDSTLRGQVPAELEAALKATRRSRSVIAPAFPSMGRTTSNGVQLVNGEPVQETGLAEDPHTPVEESHIPSLLEKGGLEDISTLGTEDVGDPEAIDGALEAKWVVVDAERYEHLENLVEAIKNPEEILWVGSGGLALALSKVYPGPSSAGASEGEPSSNGGVLVVIGSTSEVVREQLRCLTERTQIVAVPIDSRAVAGEGREKEVSNVLEKARGPLGRDRAVVLYTTLEEKLERKDAASLMDATAEIVAGLSEEGLFDALVLTGGDTAVHVARSLGADGILLEEEVEEGVPMGTLIGPKPYKVVTKAGGFGTPDTLVNALQKLTERRRT